MGSSPRRGACTVVWEMPPENVKPADIATRSGLFGRGTFGLLGELPRGINPGKIDPWGLSSFQFFPNFALLIWEAGWYNTHQFWPTSHNTLVFEGDAVLPAVEDCQRAGGAGDGCGLVQGVLAAGRQHPRGHSDWGSSPG